MDADLGRKIYKSCRVFRGRPEMGAPWPIRTIWFTAAD